LGLFCSAKNEAIIFRNSIQIFDRFLPAFSLNSFSFDFKRLKNGLNPLFIDCKFLEDIFFVYSSKNSNLFIFLQPTKWRIF